jgi:soluble lytic murein transglycosylase-like protein
MFSVCSWPRRNIKRFAGGIALAAVLIGADHAVAATPGGERQSLCAVVDQAAAANRLSAAFLTRVLWQESRFRRDALSPKGAQGVAQFMPPTALDRGLADPWEPEPAIAAAGRLLADLAARFGNIGLAAAAYNAGGARVERWLHGQADLPIETRRYVRLVTGRDAEDWALAPVRPATMAPAGAADCLQTVAQLPRALSPGSPQGGSPLDRLLAHALSLAERQPR